MRHRRKRSAAITLVLIGAVSGCSEPVPQRDVYMSLPECQRDWVQPEACEPVRDDRYSRSWFYGPAYYGRSWPSGNPRPSDNAIDIFFAGFSCREGIEGFLVFFPEALAERFLPSCIVSLIRPAEGTIMFIVFTSLVNPTFKSRP